ncbi:hypothetical protein [Paraburkholderia terrae]|uniref:hypothetical protein n=1 Tax=Paraburkholderia terrae TaxID=311230 RepID=UPI0033657BA3
MDAKNIESASTIFSSLGACWLHAMVEIDRAEAQRGAKCVTGLAAARRQGLTAQATA